MGYECYKAQGSYREYNQLTKETKTIRATVWYVPEVPQPFGPAGYDGPPGLVLESHRGSFFFIATNIRFSDQEKEVTPPDKGKRVKHAAFNKEIYQMFMEQTRKH